MNKVLLYGLEVCEFEFLSRYQIHFQTHTVGKVMSSFILPPDIGYTVSLLFFCKNGFSI